MKESNEDLLNFILWITESLLRPTLSRHLESYESWAYRNKLLYSLRHLENRRLVVLTKKARFGRISRLTEAGRLQALGGRDPAAHWDRVWDNQWRCVSFDLPETRHVAREKLRWFLRNHYFGKLQKSLWISPDIAPEIMQTIQNFGDDPNTVIVFKGRPTSNASDLAIASRAWDFAEINQAYEKCLEVLAAFPEPASKDKSSLQQLRQWMRKERGAWLAAVVLDPLLPAPLLPPGYLGRMVWEKRQQILPQATHWLL